MDDLKIFDRSKAHIKKLIDITEKISKDNEFGLEKSSVIHMRGGERDTTWKMLL